MAAAKENEKAVRSGLNFLRYVTKEYIRLEVYNNQECDGDDFFTYQVEKELVAKEDWDEFVVKLFEDIPHITDDDCIEVCDMIVEGIEYNYGNRPALMRLLRN